MRVARKKMVGKGCYYHACSRIAGSIDSMLFTDVDKEFGFKLLEEYSRLFLIEVISVCWLDNHWHCIFYASGEEPSPEVAAERHNAFYGKTRVQLDPAINPGRCAATAKRLVNLSAFMSVIQQRYTFYINRVHKRRGHLWADRFKSTILEGGSALWNCVKYVELNPVRAGIVEDPADYRFCSWGRYCGSGKHPFAKNFHKHMKTGTPTCEMTDWSFDKVCTLFRTEIARTIASELAESSASGNQRLINGGKDLQIKNAMDKAKKGDSMPVKFLRRTRHWADGAIIGSKTFVQETACMFEDSERILKKTLSRGKTATGEAIYCFRKLRI